MECRSRTAANPAGRRRREPFKQHREPGPGALARCFVFSVPNFRFQLVTFVLRFSDSGSLTLLFQAW